MTVVNFPDNPNTENLIFRNHCAAEGVVPKVVGKWEDQVSGARWLGLSETERAVMRENSKAAESVLREGD